jgi:hypothetical protein
MHISTAGDACNYSHETLYKATLRNIPIAGATKEAVLDGSLLPIPYFLVSPWHIPIHYFMAVSQHSLISPRIRAQTTELSDYKPVHVAFTGNPAHLNFGKGLGKVGFFSGKMSAG